MPKTLFATGLHNRRVLSAIEAGDNTRLSLEYVRAKS